MYGAILGDMIGAPYEFDRSKQNKDFDIQRDHPTCDKGCLVRAGVYSDIELSEQQIREGKTKDARKALSDIREKYGV